MTATAPAIAVQDLEKSHSDVEAIKGSFLGSTGCTWTVGSRPPFALVDLGKWIDRQSMELTDMHLKQPTLEDGCIELTGKSLPE